MKKTTLFALLAAGCLTAQANTTVGTLQNVSGNVTVSSDAAVTRATNGMAVTNSSSILVSTEGKATVVLNNGCMVPLKGSQHLTVDATLTCDKVHASIKEVFPAYKSAQSGTGTLLVPPAQVAPGAGGAPADGTVRTGSDGVVTVWNAALGAWVLYAINDDANSPR